MTLTAIAALNRTRVSAALPPKSLIIVAAAAGSAPHLGTQPHDLHRLTGLPLESGSVLLFPEHPDAAQREILFVSQHSTLFASPEAAADLTGISQVRWLSELESVLLTLAPLASTLYINTQETLNLDPAAQDPAAGLAHWYRQHFPAHRIEPAAPLLSGLRAVETPAELELLKPLGASPVTQLPPAKPSSTSAEPAAPSKFRRHAHWLLLLPLLADLVYSYVHHINAPHDGDMVAHVLPRYWVTFVLEDPLGLRALLHGERYGGPNRYFAHQFLLTYMRNVPLLLQSFVDAIYSVYMASAIAKTLIQAALISLLAYFATGRTAISAKYWLIAALLVTPFFQTSGFDYKMTIIESSITYTFFYALPLCLLMIYFIPVYKRLFAEEKKDIPLIWLCAMAILAIVISLSGPLMPAVSIIVFSSILIYFFRSCLNPFSMLAFTQRVKLAYNAVSGKLFWQFIFIILCSLYSQYIGTFNIENVDTYTLAERYQKMYDGIPVELGSQPAFILLLAAILINLLIINLTPGTTVSRRLTTATKWILFLCLVYTLLLPFGGYRTYRPNIIRRDSIMPVTLAFIYLFAATGLYLLFHLQRQYKRVYMGACLILIGYYSYADRPDLSANNCEVRAQEIIAASSEDVVKLPENCSVMNWGTITDPKASEEQAKMMKVWNITDREKLYYYSPWGK